MEPPGCSCLAGWLRSLRRDRPPADRSSGHHHPWQKPSKCSAELPGPAKLANRESLHVTTTVVEGRSSACVRASPPSPLARPGASINAVSAPLAPGSGPCSTRQPAGSSSGSLSSLPVGTTADSTQLGHIWGEEGPAQSSGRARCGPPPPGGETCESMALNGQLEPFLPGYRLPDAAGGTCAASSSGSGGQFGWTSGAPRGAVVNAAAPPHPHHHAYSTAPALSKQPSLLGGRRPAALAPAGGAAAKAAAAGGQGGGAHGAMVPVLLSCAPCISVNSSFTLMQSGAHTAHLDSCMAAPGLPSGSFLDSRAVPFYSPGIPSYGALSSVLSDNMGAAVAPSGDYSRMASLGGILNFDTGNVSTSVAEQLRHQLMCEVDPSGREARAVPIDVDNVEQIGKGSYGLVFRGVWQGAACAVKYLVASSMQQLQVIATEALLSKLMAHPNVVQTFACKVVHVTPDMFGQHAHQQHHHASSGASMRLEADGPVAQDVDADGNFAMPRGAVDIVIALGEEDHDAGRQHAPEPDIGGLGGRQAGAAAGRTLATNRRRSARCSMDLGIPMGINEHTETFNSDDGFGAPYLPGSCDRSLEEVAMDKYRELLLQLKASPGDFMTQMVMEYCDRGSLLRAIERKVFRASPRWNARVALRAMLRTAREIAQGMCHLHANNIVHGDLKPANVLLKSSRSDRRGFIAKVADFGLSKMCHMDRGSLECNTDSTGTLAYMAPEVLEGTQSASSDVYSFGVILWELATGEKPFADVHPGRLWVGVAEGALKLEWPDEVHHLVRKLGDACLNTDRKMRPAFTKVARVLGVIETVVRNEGAASPGCSGPRMRGVGETQAQGQPGAAMAAMVASRRAFSNCGAISGSGITDHAAMVYLSGGAGSGGAAGGMEARRAAILAAAAAAVGSGPANALPHVALAVELLAGGMVPLAAAGCDVPVTPCSWQGSEPMTPMGDALRSARSIQAGIAELVAGRRNSSAPSLPQTPGALNVGPKAPSSGTVDACPPPPAATPAWGQGAAAAGAAAAAHVNGRGAAGGRQGSLLDNVAVGGRVPLGAAGGAHGGAAGGLPRRALLRHSSAPEPATMAELSAMQPLAVDSAAGDQLELAASLASSPTPAAGLEPAASLELAAGAALDPAASLDRAGAGASVAGRALAAAAAAVAAAPGASGGSGTEAPILPGEDTLPSHPISRLGDTTHMLAMLRESAACAAATGAASGSGPYSIMSPLSPSSVRPSGTSPGLMLLRMTNNSSRSDLCLSSAERSRLLSFAERGSSSFDGRGSDAAGCRVGAATAAAAAAAALAVSDAAAADVAAATCMPQPVKASVVNADQRGAPLLMTKAQTGLDPSAAAVAVALALGERGSAGSAGLSVIGTLSE